MQITQWMTKYLHHQILLQNISIPGTHQSCAIHGILGFGKCQTQSLEYQLNNGIRYIDIRIRRTFNGLIICHQFINQNMYFQQVLRICNFFLQKNPNQFILMSLRQQYKAETKLVNEGCLDYKKIQAQSLLQCFNQDIKKIPDIENRLYSTDNFQYRKIKYGQLKGKIIILKRWGTSFIPYGLHIENFNSGQNTNIYGMKFHVQDYYQLNKIGIEGKMQEIKKQFQICQKQQKISFNMLNGYTYFQTPFNVARLINKKVLQYMQQNMQQKNWGIIGMDYFGSQDTHSIVKIMIKCNIKNCVST